MAKKKLIFDPNGDPNTERYKWHEEIMRLEGEGYNGNNPRDSAALEEAYKNYRYFAKKSGIKVTPPEKTEQESAPEKTGTINQRKYKKPWPGWGKVLEKL